MKRNIIYGLEGTEYEPSEAEIEEAAWKVNEHYSAKRSDGRDVVRFVEQITGPLDNQGKVKVTFMGGEDRGISSFELSNAIRDFGKPIPEGLPPGFGR